MFVALCFGAERGWPHDRSRERMSQHSKLIGYLAFATVIAAFVAWSKYAAISGSVFSTVLIGSAGFFVAFRMYTGVWPGNDVTR